jgi:hypothetical protein
LTLEVKNVSATVGTVSFTLDGGSARSASPLGSVGPAGGQLFSATVASGTSMSGGTAALVVTANRSEDGASLSRSLSQSVSYKNASSAC